MNPTNPIQIPANLDLLGPDKGILTVKLHGDWAGKSDSVVSPTDALLEVIRNAAEQKAESGKMVRVAWDGTALASWDSRILVAIDLALKLAETHGLETDLQGLPGGHAQIVAYVTCGAAAG